MNRRKQTLDAARRGAYRRGGTPASRLGSPNRSDWADEMGLRVVEDVVSAASDPTLQHGLFDERPAAPSKFLRALREARKYAPRMVERQALDAMIEEWER